MRALNLVGEQFGRLTVVERAANDSRGGSRWSCACVCGGQAVVRRECLRSGGTRSCGCLKRETAAAMGASTVRHGLSGSPEYKAWANAKERCRAVGNKTYAQYGARGITLDARWDTFEAFLVDMGPRPSPKHSLDRVDNDGPYSPDNCRWATWPEQRANQRCSSAPCADARRRLVARIAELEAQVVSLGGVC